MSSVANAMEVYDIKGLEGTVAFVRTFDKVLDCLNGQSSCITKHDRRPYRGPSDKRIDVTKK